MRETEKQEEDLVGEHEEEDEGRARTALGELQGGGGSVWLKFLRDAGEARELNTCLFQGSQHEVAQVGKNEKGKGTQVQRTHIALTPFRGSQSPTRPPK